MQRKTRLIVLVSGSGSNLQAILDACQNGQLDAEVCAVISNRPDAYALERARLTGIPALAFPKPKQLERRVYDRQLADLASQYQPDWVLLAGWMRLLSMPFLERFSGRVVNVHPALPGTFPGTHAIERAWEAFQQGEIEQTGVMIHLVPDEGVDDGPLLNQCLVPILPGEPIESLEERIHAVEHRLYIETIRALIQGSDPRIRSRMLT